MMQWRKLLLGQCESLPSDLPNLGKAMHTGCICNIIKIGEYKHTQKMGIVVCTFNPGIVNGKIELLGAHCQTSLGSTW